MIAFKAYLRKQFDLKRPGVTEFGVTFMVAVLLAGGSLGLLPR